MIRVQCIKYRRKNAIGGKVLEQERKKILCLEHRTEKKKPWWNWGVAVCPIEGKAQQGGMQIEILRSTATEEIGQRNIRRTFKILRKMQLNIGVEKVDIYKDITVKILLDSGAMVMFMDKKITTKHGFKLQKLERLVIVKNVDGTNNSKGAIIHQVEVNVYYKNHIERMRIDVCDLGKIDIILGMPQLQVHNLEINWKTGEVRMTRCPPIYRRSLAVKEDIEKRKKIGKRVRAVEKTDKDKWKILMEEKFDNEVKLDREKVRKMVPQRFHKWLKVFKKAVSERMLVRKPWDYAINLREDFVPRKGRIYLMSREEKEEVREFMKKQFRKGYIRPSKSPQTSPVFFVKKKNRKKRMVQDYRYLNKGTVKNSYTLPLISDLINTMGTKKVFTKMDLHQEYNNIWIKERDEQKAAFIMYFGVYEPTVMFFGLINSLATFQVIMNDILRDLIDIEDVAVFMDDILLGTKNKRKYDEIVEEVLKRIEANDLYVKPEKCV